MKVYVEDFEEWKAFCRTCDLRWNSGREMGSMVSDRRQSAYLIISRNHPNFANIDNRDDAYAIMGTRLELGEPHINFPEDKDWIIQYIGYREEIDLIAENYNI